MKHVMAVTLDTRRATISSALRLSAADAMHRTRGARSSSSGVLVTSDGSTDDDMGSLMKSRKFSVRASVFLDLPCDMERADAGADADTDDILIDAELDPA
eukprot:CAMPEP_0178729300 /NCGR_PEP_ID=MMETSP0699-20121125/28892_1 /TAXON_ID=265572 /ORGANISM="Extubocellulus spinifer, Strain CCMP396" /LENGTH=99 /DNA_ID=CAMNT_0020381209 /DNA_START=198 /DNA_END=494 /DNA_ORIENTATION=+